MGLEADKFTNLVAVNLRQEICILKNLLIKIILAVPGGTMNFSGHEASKHAKDSIIYKCQSYMVNNVSSAIRIAFRSQIKTKGKFLFDLLLKNAT